MKPEVNQEKCMHCGACVGVCPANAMTLKEYIVEINDDCTACGLCTRACPVGAIELRGE